MTSDPDKLESVTGATAPGHSALRGMAVALAACAAVTLAGLPFAGLLDAANVAMAYVLAVALVAMTFGYLPGIVASFAGVLLLDFFFVEPRLTFAVADAQYLITFVVMLAVALLIATLTARLRMQATQSGEREARAQALYQLARDVAGAPDTTEVERRVGAFLRRVFDVEVRFLLAGPGGALADDPEGAGRDVALDVSRRVLQHGEALPFLDTANGAAALALPLDAPMRRRGVLVVSARERPVAVPDSQRGLLDAVAALASIALERVHFVEVAREAQVGMESERLRTSLLSAVSHDLRTPLTVLVGLADTLAHRGGDLPGEAAAIAADIRDQSLRLSRMVENLLDMARLRSGRVEPRKAWQPLEEVIGSSLRAVEAAVPGLEVAVDVPPGLPPVEVDAPLLERALVNLLENAAKHGGGRGVSLAVRTAADRAEIAVSDAGPGLPPGDPARLFGMFERGEAEAPARGAGMGLAIVQAIVDAHGGQVRAEAREGGGARFVVSLPLGTAPAGLAAALSDAPRA